MDYEDIKRLIEDIGNSKIDNLNIEFPDGIKISMTKEKQIDENKSRLETTVSNIQNVVIPEKIEQDLKIVKSPMVGTFYSSNSPNDEPFVKVGDKVTKGQTLCIVEAMKLMNEIESDFDGEVVEVCVKNEEMVEYGKPLFKLK